MLAARGLHWPGHVQVFASPQWSSVRLDGLPVRIWGRCFTPGMASTERPLSPEMRAAFARAVPTELNIAVFHGSLEGSLPPGQELVAPFNLDEVQHAPFGWMAVGHYHRALIQPSFAYAGSPIALDTRESGAHGALDVRLQYGAGAVTAQAEFVELDPRRVHALEVDVTGAAGADQVDRRILDAMDRASVHAHDLVKIRLSGRLMNGLRWSAPGGELLTRAWHLRIDSAGLRPDWNLDALRHGSDETTEGRFARVLLERLDAETDPETRATLERALYYGLDAFRLREVAPMWEELGA